MDGSCSTRRDARNPRTGARSVDERKSAGSRRSNRGPTKSDWNRGDRAMQQAPGALEASGSDQRGD